MGHARELVDSTEATALLRLLARGSLTGAELRAKLDLDAERFRRLSSALWDATLMRGEIDDGCCNDPCGRTCIAANRDALPWRLTRKGESTLSRRVEGT